MLGRDLAKTTRRIEPMRRQAKLEVKWQGAALILSAMLLVPLTGRADSPRRTADETAGANEDSTSRKKTKKAKTPKRKKAPAPRSYLKPAADLTAKAERALEKAMEAFRAMKKAKHDRAKKQRNAVSRLKTASRAMPTSPLPHYYLGVAHESRRKFSLARRSFEKAIELQPAFYEAHVELGDLSIEEKKNDEALAAYDEALEIYPDYRKAHEHKAHALIRMGRFKEAKRHILAAESLKSSDMGKFVIKRLDAAIDGPGWKKTFTSETENYLVKTSVSQEFGDKIARYAELIRIIYDQKFSNIAKPDRKFEIIAYADKEEYHRNGGPPQAGGHYDPFFRQLFIFRYPKEKDTLLVLNHEAFHQYLQDYLEVAPQWFNEGLGDYFGAFKYLKVGKKEYMQPRPNHWRLKLIQKVIPAQRCVAAPELMTMSRKEMYDPQKAAIYYAQSWGMIYFMFEGKQRSYGKVLIRYFEALRKGMDIEEAYNATFGKIDMVRFDRHWKDFIMNLEEPKD